MSTLRLSWLVVPLALALHRSGGSGGLHPVSRAFLRCSANMRARALPPLTAALHGRSLALVARPRACAALRAARLGTSHPRLAPSRVPLRCFAAQRDERRGDGGRDKSWGELLADAKDLARCGAESFARCTCLGCAALLARASPCMYTAASASLALTRGVATSCADSRYRNTQRCC